MLISAETLQNHLDDPAYQLIEVSAMAAFAYDDGHIPGAIGWPWQATLWDAGQREFISPENFAALMRRSGVTPETTLVFYSSDLQFATYALWTCVLRGHNNVAILDGGRKRWMLDKRPMTQAVPTITPSDYPIRAPNEAGRIRRDGVLAGLHNPDRVLLDVRSPEEYNGLRVMPGAGLDHGAQVKGRIPGARHLYFRELLNEDDTFKSAETLRAIFAERGANASRDIVTYCRLSHRATFTWFVAHKLLGFPRVRSYDGSWTEWGSMVGMPIEIDE